MELPWLKNKTKNQGGGGATIERVAEGRNPHQLLELVAEEMLSALERKDRANLQEALRAFLTLIKEQTEDSDG